MGRAFRIGHVKNKVNMLIDYLTLRDYDRAEVDSTDRIIKRQSRGSIFAQNGWYINRRQLDKQSREADKHISNLRKAVRKVNS